MRTSGAAWCVVGVVLLTGCATTSAGTASPFTSAEQLKKLTSGKKPEKVFTSKTADLEQWTLVGPLPTELSLAPHEQATPAGRFIAAEAAKRGAMATSALACAARELAHFVVEKRAQPPILLKDAITGRCGVGTTLMSSDWLEGETGDATDDQLIELMAPKFAPVLERAGRSTALGAALARSGTHGVLVVVRVEQVGTLETMPLVPVSGAVTLHGTAAPGIAELAAVITQGERGSAPCEDLHLRALPAYDLRCPVLASDETAWISVATRAQGRLLSQELRRLLVWPKGTTSTQWALPQLVPPGTAPTVEAVAAQLNALRTGAGLKALTLSPAQSADQHEVAPFLFQAIVTGDSAAADQLGLGLLAGWHVERDIISGNFSAEAAERDDGSLLLTHALLSPSMRAMLFDPAVSVLGLGLYREDGMVGGVFSVYRGLEQPAYPAAAQALLKQLDAARAKVSRGPATWTRIAEFDERRLADALAKRQASVSDALTDLIQTTVNTTNRGARGYSFETSSLEGIEWPAELVNAEQLEVGLVVASTRAPGSAWGHYVVLMSLPEAP